MSGEVQVRFCERLGVRFPGPTHLVVGFEHRDEAERFLKEFGERLAKFAPGTASGEDAVDLVRTKCRTGARGAGGREAGEFHVSGVCA
jgi:hypothetical protein